MFLQLQKASFTNSLLESQGDLWRSQTAVGVKNRSGLGLKNQLAAYKFCWLSPAMIDWNKWTFGKSFSQSTAFDYIQIHPTALHKTNHLLYQKSQWEILERFAELLREIEDCSSHETYRILAFLGTMVIQKFRIDVCTALFKFCDSEWKEDSETKREMALKGQLPLDYDNVLSFSPSRFARIKYSNKHKLNLQERWEILFHTQDKWEEQDLRKAWKDKPYRLYFEKCYTLISEACDAKTAQCWEYLLVQTQFARANFLLPSPAKHSFLQKQTQVGQVSKIYWVPLQHESWPLSVGWRTLPVKGSQGDQWKKWSIDYYSPIPEEYESPSNLFMEKLQPQQVLDRFLKKILHK
ncbi:hypothetical protein B9Z19DRAFT_1069999 [Tuber borchii]|nr:hypothetical protein B9Z19DRAFT_1069999 [Tuber borchii]